MAIYRCLTLSLLISFFCFASLANETPLKVLVIDGYSNHNWQLNSAIICGILEPTGLFDLTVSTAPASSDAPVWDEWRPDFSAYDVVIQTCNDISGGPAWPDEVKTSFETYLHSGGSVFIYHSANNAFADWEAYNRIIGIGWRNVDYGTALEVSDNGTIIRIPPGEGRGTGHGPRVDAQITRIGDHPIHQGLPRKWMTPDIEVYYYPRGPAEEITVLSYAFDKQTLRNWPIEWVVNYGKGRVYSGTYGHVWHDDEQPDRMRCVGVQTLMIRALCWLGRKQEMPGVPDDFPTETDFSIRPEVSLLN